MAGKVKVQTARKTLEQRAAVLKIRLERIETQQKIAELRKQLKKS